LAETEKVCGKTFGDLEHPFLVSVRSGARASMLILPLVAIVAGYIVYMKKFTIDEKRYAQILSDLKARGDIAARPEQN